MQPEQFDAALEKAWASAFRDGKYDYATYGHRKWRQLLMDAGDGCVVCGRGRRSKRTGRRPKRQRLHAHHVRGYSSHEGVLLCPSDHDLVTLLAGHAKHYTLNEDSRRVVDDLVQQRMEGTLAAKDSIRQ